MVLMEAFSTAKPKPAARAHHGEGFSPSRADLQRASTRAHPTTSAHGEPARPTSEAHQQQVWLRDVLSPSVRDLAALLQQVGASVGGFDGVLDDVREARLGQLTADGRLGAPVAKR